MGSIFPLNSATSGSISLALVSPATRGATNVSIFDNIHLIISSTAEKLDINSLIFTINDYELKPSAYFTGASNVVSPYVAGNIVFPLPNIFTLAHSDTSSVIVEVDGVVLPPIDTNSVTNYVVSAATGNGGKDQVIITSGVADGQTVTIGYTWVAPNEKVLNIIFYSVNRLKYGKLRYKLNNENYGGATDNTSNFLYNQSYKVKVRINTDPASLTPFEDFFTFYTEIGTQYNSKIPKYLMPNSLQYMGNYFPSWARARTDSFSNYQQFMTPICENLDKIDLFLAKGVHDNYLTISNKNELSRLYQIYLDEQYDFNTVVLEGGRKVSIPPTITAYFQHHQFKLNAEKSNSLDSFFYNKIPTNLTVNKANLPAIDFISGEIKLETQEFNKRLQSFSGFYLNIKATGAFSSFGKQENVLKILTCRIKGESYLRKPQHEDIVIGGPGYFRTTKRWNKIESITFYNLRDDLVGTFSLDYFKVGESHVSNVFKYIDQDRNSRASYWRLRQPSSSLGSIAELAVEIGDPMAMLVNKMEMIIEDEYELFDVDNITPLVIKDIEIDKFGGFLYGVNDEYLYLFYKQAAYPEVVKDLPSENSSVQMMLTMDHEVGARENGVKTFTFHGQQIDLSKKIIRYRFRIMFPNNEIKYIKEDGTLVPDVQKAEANVQVKENIALIKTRSISLSLSDAGDYVLLLDTLTTDGAIGTDSLILRVKSLSAIAKYKLNRFTNGRKIIALLNDFDSNLKIIDENKFIYTITPIKQNFLIDYENKRVFFNEKYQKVVVS